MSKKIICILGIMVIALCFQSVFADLKGSNVQIDICRVEIGAGGGGGSSGTSSSSTTQQLKEDCMAIGGKWSDGVCKDVPSSSSSPNTSGTSSGTSSSSTTQQLKEDCMAIGGKWSGGVCKDVPSSSSSPNTSSGALSGALAGATVGNTNGTSAGTLAGATSDEWWQKAFHFWSGGNLDSVNSAMGVLDPVIGIITAIGNMIFIVVTVVLGVKYIWGGAESKAGVKDGLVTLVVAALVFYGWNTIRALFMNGSTGNLIFVQSTVISTATRIYSIILYVCNFLAIGGIVYVGVQYFMAGAEGKAKVKAQSIPVVLGAIMVYATITFLNLIVGIL